MDSKYFIIDKGKQIDIKSSYGDTLEVFQPHYTVLYGISPQHSIDITSNLIWLKNHETNLHK